MIRKDDVIAPAIVTAADIITSDYKPTWNRPIGIGLAAAGYVLGGMMGVGGNLMKQIGVASFSWGVGSLYQMVKGGGAARVYNRSSVSRRVSRAPGTAYVPGFEGLKLD